MWSVLQEEVVLPCCLQLAVCKEMLYKGCFRGEILEVQPLCVNMLSPVLQHREGCGDCAQGRNVESFDHVKKDLKIEEEGAAEKDPAFFLKTEGLSEDMKRVMAKLYTPDALKASHLSSHCFHRTPVTPPGGWE